MPTTNHRHHDRTSQRAGVAVEACAAYGRMLHHRLRPDVFTMTALIDVTGRSGDSETSHAMCVWAPPPPLSVTILSPARALARHLLPFAHSNNSLAPSV